jgi:2-haloacid dehalogenase
VPTPPGPIRAVAFDLFTIFDPRGVTQLAEEIAPGTGAALVETWRTRWFEYAFLRAAAGRYRDFGAVSEDALAFAAHVHAVTLAPAERRRLVEAYTRLPPWPEARAALGRLKAAGLALAPLANFTPAMIEALVDSAGLADSFDHQLSTDAVKTYKPHPRAYQVAVDAFGLPREAIAFAAFGGWDAAGASWFGFPTFWVNHLGVPHEELTEAPLASGADLDALEAWVLGGRAKVAP